MATVYVTRSHVRVVPRLTDFISVMNQTIFPHELKENPLNPPAEITHLTYWPRSLKEIIFIIKKLSRLISRLNMNILKNNTLYYIAAPDFHYKILSLNWNIKILMCFRQDF